MRLWCPICGKSAGLVRRERHDLVMDGVSRFERSAMSIRFGKEVPDRPPEWLTARRTHVLAGPSDTDDSWHTTCTGGHDLVANSQLLRAAFLAGRRAHVLPPMSDVLDVLDADH